ncbi:MAG: molybdopterin-dependent oxidoreductase [Slackia sp.]|nr:molybdopterin-dependent oxidoreductase [Slackia sp.]
MAQLTMSRRGFVAAMAATGAACAASSSTVAPLQAFAEDATNAVGEIQHVRSCCRACGKVECGVWVTVLDGKAIKVEGDESAPQSRGHCCAKSQASMQAAYHPDRLRYPVKRTNPKGSDDPGWVRITLDEAFELTGKGLGEVVDKYGGQAVFVMCGTSRVWSLGPYQGMKQLFGTPNAHLAYQVCKGPRHWGGIMTDEMGSPWMEVEAEPKVYWQWGTAVEYSNYDTTNRTISDVRAHATAHIVTDPRVTPLSKEADIWLNLRPSTDGALALGLFNWVIENEGYDDTMVRRWSNAPFLFCDDKPWLTVGHMIEGNGGIDMRTKLITEADVKEGGSVKRFLVWDENNQRITYWDAEAGKWEGERHKIPTTGSFISHPLTGLVADAWLPDESTWADPADEAYDPYWDEGNERGKVTNPLGLPKKPALFPGEIEITLRDGTVCACRTVWDGFHDLTSQYTPEKVEEITGVAWEKCEEAIKIYTTRVDPRHGNGGIHFQLSTDQNGHAVQNCRILQMLSCVTGNSDEPAGNRGSCKSQFDGNPGRSNMQASDPYGDEALTWDGRDYSLEDMAHYMQDFVQYLIDEESPLAERYGNKVPSDEEALIIAKRMGGAMNPSQKWPNPATVFTRNAGEVDAERFPLNRFWARWVDANCVWDACLQDPDWDKAVQLVDRQHNEPFEMHIKETPYALHGGVCQSGDIMNMANTVRAWNGMTQLDFFADIDLWFCPTNGNADVIFPCQHWLEIDSTRVSQGAGGMFGCACKAIEPPGETIYDPDWNCGMYKAMGVPWNTRDTEATGSDQFNFKPTSESNMKKWKEKLGDAYQFDTPSYLWPDHDRILKDNVDAWKTEQFPDGPTWAEAKQWFTDHGWMDCREWHPERWGTYRRHEMGWRRQQGGFNLFPLVDLHPGFMTASGLIEIWSLTCEAYICNGGDQGRLFNGENFIEPDDRWSHTDIEIFQGDDDRFPLYREATDSPVARPELYSADTIDQVEDEYFQNQWYKEAIKAYPDNVFLQTTGSRQPVYFHSEHRQLPWCRELWPAPRIEINPRDAARIGVEQGDWVWIESPWGRIREVVDLYYGIKGTTEEGNLAQRLPVSNANHQWWFPEFDYATHGFELVGVNCLNNPYGQDPVGGCHTMRGYPVVIYKATAENSPNANPVPCNPITGEECIYDASDPRLRQWMTVGMRARFEGEPDVESYEHSGTGSVI